MLLLLTTVVAKALTERGQGRGVRGETVRVASERETVRESECESDDQIGCAEHWPPFSSSSRSKLIWGVRRGV
jgi:hypothetical protein